MIKSKLLSQFPELVHGFSTIDYGNMKLNSDFNIEQTVKNRRVFCANLKISINELVNADLAHTANIKIVGQEERSRGAKEIESLISQTDGLIANEKNLFLMTTGADCPPVLFYDQIKQVVGNIHVGWRGLLQGIVSNAVEILKTKYGCQAKDINVFIGPGIERCHFEVGNDVSDKFAKEYKKFVIENNNKKQINLKGIIKFILLNNGFKNDNIDISPDCTFCHDDLYSSYRREGKNFKAMGAVIGIRGKCKKINHLSF